MSTEDRTRDERIERLEKRVADLEQRSISREALDEEIASLERRLAELREQEIG